ncbi:hypothetical protein [Candidatus Nitrotoga sp. AM1P]|uniref:hypothetical protein n=1 Tax=Candidatus Nitrotoga sp. AM1P TaxID=2559597 RepID=UPI0010B60B46|nr:hypothetical protein [Candidatus Nitrotoga sp. AM1P]BBJ23477.1 hypothetical protein W01_14040 [Candidatus Nitrotoga sp. AM1P]
MIIKRNIFMTEEIATKTIQAWNTNTEVLGFLKLQDRCFLYFGRPSNGRNDRTKFGAALLKPKLDNYFNNETGIKTRRLIDENFVSQY